MVKEVPSFDSVPPSSPIVSMLRCVLETHSLRRAQQVE